MSMAQRSDFARRDDDFYPTPWGAVVPLLPHLKKGLTFDEPCCGDRSLVDHIEALTGGEVTLNWASDIVVRTLKVDKRDALEISDTTAQCFITNPPYKWSMLQPIMTQLYSVAPTWLLLPAAMAHNQRMGPHMKKCLKIVSIGRVQWFEGTPGTLDYAWYLFDANHNGPTEFYGRGQDYITKNDQA